jgi:hypothetical protein
MVLDQWRLVRTVVSHACGNFWRVMVLLDGIRTSSTFILDDLRASRPRARWCDALARRLRPFAFEPDVGTRSSEELPSASD